MKLKEINFKSDGLKTINDSDMEFKFENCNIVLIVKVDGTVIDIKKYNEEKNSVVEIEKAFNTDIDISGEIRIEYEYGFYEYTRIDMEDEFLCYKYKEDKIYINKNFNTIFIKIEISNGKSILFDSDNNLIGFIISESIPFA